MPSSSKAQARFVAMKARQGKKWAKEWHRADKRKGTKHLPTRKGKK